MAVAAGFCSPESALSQTKAVKARTRGKSRCFVIGAPRIPVLVADRVSPDSIGLAFTSVELCFQQDCILFGNLNLMLRAMVLCVCLEVSTLAAEEADRVLFSFDTADAAKQWNTVNDGVMGGRSEGRFKITDDKTMQFFGTLSLENNGGFASVRTRPTKLDLKKGDELILRVRGDGRQYSLNLYVPRPLVAFSYRASFETKKDKWVEVRLPLDDFVATSFGRVVTVEKGVEKVTATM